MSFSTQLPVTNQPQANLNLRSLDFKQSIPVHEKSLDASLENSYHYRCEHGQTSFSEHHSCHSIRLRRFLLPAIFALVALGGLLAWSYVYWHGLPTWGVDLMGRALDSTSTGSPFQAFLQNKCQLAPLTLDLLIIINYLRNFYSFDYRLRGFASFGCYRVECMLLSKSVFHGK